MPKGKPGRRSEVISRMHKAADHAATQVMAEIEGIEVHASDSLRKEIGNVIFNKINEYLAE